MILFDLQMILICQLFHLNDHFFLLFCFDLLFYHHLHFHFHNLHLYFHISFYNLHFHLFYFLLFHFLDFLMSCQLKLYLINHHKFNNFLCREVRFLYFIICAFFILFNAFKSFLVFISLIVLFHQLYFTNYFTSQYT